MLTNDLREKLSLAKKLSKNVLFLTEEKKNDLLNLMAKRLTLHSQDILKANQDDMQNGVQKGLSEAFLDRLLLTTDRIESMAEGLETLSTLPDPSNTILSSTVLDNGLKIEKVSVPFGTIGMIYESRPNVTSDVVGLCLKSGNTVVLRGGSDSLHSNQAIVDVLHGALVDSGYEKDWVVFLSDKDRKMVIPFLNATEFIDLIVPRGGKSLNQMVAEHSTVPVLKHYEGICHVYVDVSANEDKAVNIVLNAKCQRPGVCNALETLLIHRDVAKSFLETVYPLLKAKSVEVRGCSLTKKLLKAREEIVLCSEEDWRTEYLDLILSIKIVQDIDEAIDHINTYGSGHSDAIVTENEDCSERFFRCVDSATVYQNASTRFTDGGVFGMGVELGISTDKLHARGPIGLNELLTYKYIVRGDGQIRQ